MKFGIHLCYTTIKLTTQSVAVFKIVHNRRIRWAVHVTRIEKINVLDVENLGKLLVGRLRSISKNVTKTYSMEV